MNTIIRLEQAMDADKTQIRDLMVEVQQDERVRWYAAEEGPHMPGFSSIDMQRYHMWDGKYYKIMADESLAGVILISSTGREHARIDRFYIHPLFQNNGVGSKVIELIEHMLPEVKIWTLDTPQKSPRNHYFYEKYGYVLSGEDEQERYYCKVVGEPSYLSDKYTANKDLQGHNYRDCNMENVDYYNINLGDARFSNSNMANVIMQNINYRDSRITNANLSNSTIGDSNMRNMEIGHVVLAGAHIHDVNLYLNDEEKAPIIFERCDLTNSRIFESDLRNVEIDHCHVEGMKINGVLVSELFEIYRKKQCE